MRIAVLLILLALQAGFAQDAPPSMETRSRQVLDLWLAGNYGAVYDMFSADMKKISLETYSKQSEQVKALGAVQQIGEAEVSKAGPNSVVGFPLTYPSAKLEFRVAWDPQGQIAGTFLRPLTPPPSAADWQPPAYSKGGSFEARDVTFGSDDWKLPGTLTVPKGAGPFPAIVLVHGSGPQDRDESVGKAKVFRDLAEGLSSRGIAVLRYDKRTKVFPQKVVELKNFTINDETVDDAVRAVEMLRLEKSIDSKRILVLGHSQGGQMAPRIGQRDPRVGGLIILAGNVRPIEELIPEQTEYLMEVQGVPEEVRQKKLAEVRQEMEQVKKLQPGDKGPAMLPAPASYFIDLRDYNPAAEAAKLKMPILILQGERDYQVTMKDFGMWKAALGERENVSYRSYPRLNHLMAAGEGKSKPAEYQQPGHVDEQVIDDIAKWVSAR